MRPNRIVLEDEADPAFLESIKNITCVVDHMAHLHFDRGLDQPACRWLVHMLKNEGWWMMLSNGNRDSKMENGFDEAAVEETFVNKNASSTLKLGVARHAASRHLDA